MLNRKNIITGLLVIALGVVIFLSMYNRSQHGDPGQWMKEHGEVAARHADLNDFCLDCHNKKFRHTKENFCNKCHSQTNVKLVR